MNLTNSEIVELTAFRHELHQHPEVSREESETAQRVAARLDRIGADEIVTGLGGHGVAAIYEGAEDGPTVLLRAELDGLPIEETGEVEYRSTVAGKAHMCGHDGHSTSLLACAIAFSKQPPQRGRVILMFQPAEEDGSGAAAVIADEKFARLRPDYAFSWHNMPGFPLGSAQLRDGPMLCASVGFRAALTGRTAHASQPETGVSPALAIAGLMQDLAALGAGGEIDEDFALVTLTHAKVGEPTYGVAPGQGAVQATLRALMPERIEELKAGAEAAAKARAEEGGLEVAIEWHDDFAATLNDPEATAILRRSFEACDIPYQELDAPYRGSEDFGRFGSTARMAMIFLGSGEDISALHNPDYDFPDELIPIGARLMVHAARQVVR